MKLTDKAIEAMNGYVIDRAIREGSNLWFTWNTYEDPEYELKPLIPGRYINLTDEYLERTLELILVTDGNFEDEGFGFYSTNSDHEFIYTLFRVRGIESETLREYYFVCDVYEVTIHNPEGFYETYKIQTFRNSDIKVDINETVEL